MKYFKTSLMLMIVITQLSATAQEMTLGQLRQLQEEQRRQAELNSAEMRRLEDERARLGQRLTETTQQITSLQGQTNTPQSVTISFEEIARTLDGKNFDSCKITAGEQIGVYYIQRDKLRIRFVFLSKEDTLAPQAKIETRNGSEIFQIHQPEYDPQNITQKGSMTAMLRFSLNQQGSVVDVRHATFTGLVASEEGRGMFSGWFRSGPAEGSVATIACVLRD